MKSSRHNFVLMIFYWNRTVKLWKFSHSTVITLRFCILVIILWKLYHLLLSYRQKRCFSIWHPYAILNLKIGILGKSLLSRVTAWFSVANFVIIRSFFTDIRQHNDFHIIGRAPCWISSDVFVLHPVIDFYGPGIVLNFHVGWFGSLHVSFTYVQLATERQTDRQTTLHRDLFPFVGWGLNQIIISVVALAEWDEQGDCLDCILCYSKSEVFFVWWHFWLNKKKLFIYLCVTWTEFHWSACCRAI